MTALERASMTAEQRAIADYAGETTGLLLQLYANLILLETKVEALIQRMDILENK
jgi:hypothetical protein